MGACRMGKPLGVTLAKVVVPDIDRAGPVDGAHYCRTCRRSKPVGEFGRLYGEPRNHCKSCRRVQDERYYRGESYKARIAKLRSDLEYLERRRKYRRQYKAKTVRVPLTGKPLVLSRLMKSLSNYRYRLKVANGELPEYRGWKVRNAVVLERRIEEIGREIRRIRADLDLGEQGDE